MAKFSKHDLALVSARKIRARGVSVRKDSAPADRRNDLLYRYKEVPNRMMLFYAPEDKVLEEYVRTYWASLDGMSGQICDIFVSLLQLRHKENVYEFRNEIPNIPGNDRIQLDMLPMVSLWSENAFIVMSLQRYTHSSQLLTRWFRTIFEFLHTLGRGILVSDYDDFKERIEQLDDETQAVVPSNVEPFEGRVVVNNNNITAREGAVVVNNGSEAGNIDTDYARTESGVNRKELAEELARLREEIQRLAEGNNSTVNRDIENLDQAERCVADGKCDEASEFLKKSSNWLLEVAKSVSANIVVRILSF